MQLSPLARRLSFTDDSELKGYQVELESWANDIRAEIIPLLPKTHFEESFHNVPIASHSESNQKNLEHRIRMLDKCSTYNYQAACRQILKRETTNWIAVQPEYRNFITCNEPLTLFCLGKAGSGKSVTLANMAQHLGLDQRGEALICYFFCRWDEPESVQARTILGSLARQLLYASPEALVPEDLTTTDRQLFDTTKILQVLNSTLQRAKKSFIVLDGLDECNDTQRDKVIASLQELQTLYPVTICLSLRLGIGYTLAERLWGQFQKPAVIEVIAHNDSMERFIDDELQHRLGSQELAVGDPALLLEIRDALLKRAQGNFVWVDMQIRSLCEQMTDYAIRKVLDSLSQIEPAAINPESLQDMQHAPTAPFTDSAYVSASFPASSRMPKNDSLDSTEEVSDDLATEYSYDSRKLLKAFALKVGFGGPTQMHKDLMAFVHKHRSEIAEAFIRIYFDRADEVVEREDQSACMNLQERMDLWEKNEETEQIPLEEELEGLGLLEVTESEEAVECWLTAYREFAPNTEAYSWLLTQLQREFRFASESGVIRIIRDQVLSSLPSPRRISRSMPSQSCSARFHIDWDLLGFFEAQRYSSSPEQVLPGVITLTGTSCDAQAMTCAQYMNQTWPLTGNRVLQLLREVLQQEQGHSHSCQLPDGTTLTVCTMESKVMAQATGVAASISETAEQLAWLGATLRTSQRQNGLTYCTSSIKVTHQNGTRQQDFNLDLPSADIVCEITFETDSVPAPGSFANGQCWHDIFKNPTIAQGYPILRRTKINTGLEIPLNIMVGLARAQRIDRFNGRVYIKGFSTMLVPTKLDQGMMYWHLIHKQDGGRISYLDDDLDREDLVVSLNLTHVRHVLGWCSEAKFYAGSALAHYNIAHSELPKPHAECALAATLVSLGKMVTGGSRYELGIKDTPVHIARNGYISQLKWISTKFVLFWDEQDKRGWLINGTSALLHVVRASLVYDSTDKFRSAFLFKSGDLRESPKPFTPDSAIDMLIDSKNLRLNLYPEKDGHIVFKDRVDQFYNLLEKMLDHQTDITRHNGGSLMGKPRKFLEGWDFKDLATSRDPLHPRVASIHAAGKGWVDLMRALHAVTLIGRDFGEILRPVNANVCRYWATLPKQRWLISSCVSDLESVVRDNRVCNDEHAHLSDELIWHTPTTSMACQCVAKDHTDPIQTIVPSALSYKIHPRECPLNLEGNGAVVFGRNQGFPLVWGDTGHPLLGPPQGQAFKPTPDDDRDSGIGRSFASSRSEGRASALERSGTPHSTMSMSESLKVTMRSEGQIYGRNQYTAGILCALPIEMKAIRALFDERHQSPTGILGDENQYVLGQMAQHMVVATSLPAGEYGTNAAASAISDMMRSFLSLQFCLLVGVAGGAPSEENDIWLGDVVVSLPTRVFPGVIQYDLGKEKSGSEFELTGVLQRPPRVLTNAISKLRSDPDLGINPLDPHITKIINSLPTYGSPGPELDILFKTPCSQKNCTDGCSHLEQRLPRLTTEPRIHYGLIASGNRVVKDAVLRDQLQRQYGMLCFEMEAAGVMNRANCLVIRGICDYCDAQKNKDWQSYAAATAAAYAKLLLGAVAVNEDTSGSNLRGDNGPMPKRRKVEAGYVD
ncbi:hypothetical protein KAF25_005851 [Fusarium avenaceum]|uniref:NACHT domain-containing protein n=1 Tax=Fusarium avenaceum TaxID=40199 RepID=A0A9P7GQE4_9HYPO|nr:hypothetical protein KAF25_005851 [Fusarium avenaceum]